MTSKPAIAAYWSLFAVGLVGGLAILVLLALRINAAFENGALTRQTLIDSLAVSFVALGVLIIAGWAFAGRPRDDHAPDEAESVFA